MNAKAPVYIEPLVEDHAPELYAESGLAESIDGLDRVDNEAFARYQRDGFLAIENVFTPDEVRNALAGMDDLVMGRYPEFNRIIFEGKAKDLLHEISPNERVDLVRKMWRFSEVEPRLQHLALHPGMMEVISRIIGEPAVLLQDMALIKPPKIGREKPWHQDHAYVDVPLGSPVVIAWIALDEATLENGCMRLLSGGHHAGPRTHFMRRDWQICDTEMAGVQSLAVPLRPGGVLLFDGLLPHGTPSNRSPQRRRAMQNHYHGESVQMITKEERVAIFGPEGKDVSC